MDDPTRTVSYRYSTIVTGQVEKYIYIQVQRERERNVIYGWEKPSVTFPDFLFLSLQKFFLFLWLGP